jgi:excisionase family DNA binding protein
MTRREVADELRVSLSALGDWLREGRLPIIRMGKAIRVRRSDVQKFLKAKTVPKRSAAAEQRSQMSA